MSYFQSLSNHKFHAKYISRQLGIKLTHAQDVVATLQNKPNWSSVKSDPSDTYGFHVQKPEIEHAKNIIAGYSKEISRIVSAQTGRQSRKLAEALEGRLRTRGVSNYTSDFEELRSGLTDKEWLRMAVSKSELRELIATEILEKLVYGEDLEYLIMEMEKSNKLYTKFHYLPHLLGHQFYCSYYRKGKFIDVNVREWDTSMPVSIVQTDSIAYKRWFASYMIGFLKHVANVLASLGYDGCFRICKVKNVLAYHHYNNLSGKRKHEGGVYRFFDTLIEMGATFSYPEYEASYNQHAFLHGYKLPFSSQSRGGLQGGVEL